MSGAHNVVIDPNTLRPVLELGDTIQVGQMRAAIASAAVGFVSAGIHDGKVNVSPDQAVEAAAEIYNIVHTAALMRAMMKRVAAKHGGSDAYSSLVRQSTGATQSR
jgi:hypothetical protein